MIRLERVTRHQTRDFTKQCIQNCSLCRNPCEKQNKYAPIRPPERPAAMVVIPTRQPPRED